MLPEYLEESFLDVGDDPAAWAARGAVVLDRPYMRLVALRRPDPWSNWATRVRLLPEQVPTALREAREFFAGEGVPYAWWTGPATRPSDLGAHLEAAGWRLLEEIEGLALRLPAALERLHVNPRVRVVEVRDETMLRTALRLDEGYGSRSPAAFEAAVARLAPRLADPGYRWLLGYLDNFPVGVAGLEFRRGGEVAYLAGATTLPEWRGRGVYATLTAARLHLAQDQGTRWALTHAVAASAAPICRAAGFQRMCVLRAYSEI